MVCLKSEILLSLLTGKFSRFHKTRWLTKKLLLTGSDLGWPADEPSPPSVVEAACFIYAALHTYQESASDLQTI